MKNQRLALWVVVLGLSALECSASDGKASKPIPADVRRVLGCVLPEHGDHYDSVLREDTRGGTYFQFSRQPLPNTEDSVTKPKLVTIVFFNRRRTRAFLTVTLVKTDNLETEANPFLLKRHRIYGWMVENGPYGVVTQDLVADYVAKLAKRGPIFLPASRYPKTRTACVEDPPF